MHEDMPVNMCDIDIRPSQQQDIEVLQQIEQSSGQIFKSQQGLEWIANDEIFSRDQHQAAIDRGLSWLVSVHAEAAGFLVAQIYDSELYIMQLSVHENFMHQRLGAKLIEHLQDYGRSHGFVALTLSTFKDVAWNAPYYARLGFEIIPPHQIPAYLNDIIEQERQHGIPIARRCVMRKQL